MAAAAAAGLQEPWLGGGGDPEFMRASQLSRALSSQPGWRGAAGRVLFSQGMASALARVTGLAEARVAPVCDSGPKQPYLPQGCGEAPL